MQQILRKGQGAQKTRFDDPDGYFTDFLCTGLIKAQAAHFQCHDCSTRWPWKDGRREDCSKCGHGLSNVVVTAVGTASTTSAAAVVAANDCCKECGAQRPYQRPVSLRGPWCRECLSQIPETPTAVGSTGSEPPVDSVSV